MELKEPGIIDAIREHSADGSPRVHAVTIGELERGVSQADDDVTRGRRRVTLRFAREQLAPISLDSDGDQSEAFGRIAAALSRRISHHDNWITAAAVTERRQVLTQDATLAEKATHAALHEARLRTWMQSRSYSLEIIHVPRLTT